MVPALYVHVDDPTHEAIQAIAKAEERAITVVARNLLREAIAARKDSVDREEETIA